MLSESITQQCLEARKELGERLALKVLSSAIEPSPRKRLYGRLYTELDPWQLSIFWKTIEAGQHDRQAL